MLRSLANGCFYENAVRFLPTQYQIIRWKRKPRKPFWLGTARSKRFIIHDEPVLPPEERAELLRLHANYRTSVKSIRKYLEGVDTNEAAAVDTTSYKASDEEIEASMKVNDAWNKDCAILREERMIQRTQEHEELAIEVMSRVDETQTLLQERVEQLVRAEKEKSRDFITKENLDKKIEECLSSETDYNYAIDLQGNMFTGYETEMKAFPLDLSESVRKVCREEK